MSQFNALEVSPELISAASAGDVRAHEAIFRVCQRPLYTLIRRLIPRAAAADDVFQDTCVEMLRSIGAYSGAGSFGGWVRSIAVSKCLMYLRSPWHRSLSWLDDEGGEVTELMEPAAGPALQTESQADLARALAELPALSRTVVWLHDVEGYTHQEIARLLGRTTSFSKSQLARAHARLRECLSRERSEAPAGSAGEPRSTASSTGALRAAALSSVEDAPSTVTLLAPIRD